MKDQAENKQKPKASRGAVSKKEKICKRGKYSKPCDYCRLSPSKKKCVHVENSCVKCREKGKVCSRELTKPNDIENPSTSFDPNLPQDITPWDDLGMSQEAIINQDRKLWIILGTSEEELDHFVSGNNHIFCFGIIEFSAEDCKYDALVWSSGVRIGTHDKLQV
ncbi:2510_t:CDS:2 [Acaulospora morrowiae]|uniref:2510_t:CDS:1 n=1 Tax=Acaulospora morrowiae TaxID=94023 RepID=A0A9N8V4T9_9GLOM|nr:2510_t:CDS:2 [Acaulospora morrowiae]